MFLNKILCYIPFVVKRATRFTQVYNVWKGACGREAERERKREGGREKTRKKGI